MRPTGVFIRIDYTQEGDEVPSFAVIPDFEAYQVLKFQRRHE